MTNIEICVGIKKIQNGYVIERDFGDEVICPTWDAVLVELGKINTAKVGEKE